MTTIIDKVLIGTSIAMFVIGVFAMAWLTWSLKCNSVTRTERLALIEALYSADTFTRHRAILDRVTYHDHLNERRFFRDPWLLYPVEVATEAKRHIPSQSVN